MYYLVLFIFHFNQFNVYETEKRDVLKTSLFCLRFVSSLNKYFALLDLRTCIVSGASKIIIYNISDHKQLLDSCTHPSWCLIISVLISEPVLKYPAFDRKGLAAVAPKTYADADKSFKLNRVVMKWIMSYPNVQISSLQRIISMLFIWYEKSFQNIHHL